MANLAGGVYITFEKPYLNKVADIIMSNKPLKFDGNISQKINMTDHIDVFIKAVKAKDQNAINKVLQSGSKYSPIFNGYTWTKIDKGQFTQKGGGSDAKSTTQQELGSLFAIQKGIENNGYTNQAQFMKLYRDELLHIYPNMNEEWENTFFQQQLTTYREVGNTKYSHYSRDGGFMDYITDLVKSLYGISKKDTWNPADIWLVSNYNNVKRTLDNAIKDNTTSLQEFNAILRNMFKDRKIVGISLKLMSGNKAKWELVNLENDDLFDNDEYRFYHESSQLSLNLKPGPIPVFSNTDSKINISSKKQTIKFQIRQNSAGFNNLKIEGTDIGASAARLGKVPLDMATPLFTGSGLEGQRWRRWQNYPTSAEQYNNEKNIHESRFNKLKGTNKVDFGGVRDSKQFSDNILKIYTNGKPDIAMSKLMQLDVLNEIYSLRGDKLNNFLTNLSFLAQKKGSVFGPFAKLY